MHLPKSSDHYDTEFYSTWSDGSSSSARRIAPIVTELIGPGSVVDIGCGIGAWLEAFGELGVERLLGLDGDYVERSLLRIPADCFRECDLSGPVAVDESFDLAVSLEVAEHLPPELAEKFVGTLTRLAPAVLFSSAVPHQGGNNHVNEQWADYWFAFFRENNYEPIDCIRPRVWDDPDVEYWYAQNAFLYVRRDVLEASPSLTKERDRYAGVPTRLVHPRKYESLARRNRCVEVAADIRNMPLKTVISALPGVAARAVRRRLPGAGRGA